MADTDTRMQRLAANLRKARVRSGMTHRQAQAASGVWYSVVADIEAGRRPPSIPQLLALAKAYRAPRGSLLKV